MLYMSDNILYMSQRTVIIFIAITLLVLTVFLVLLPGIFIPFGPDSREAIHTFLSSGGSLAQGIHRISEPYISGGSLDNLKHFLSKDPGRNEFARRRDRRRMDAYLAPLTENINASGYTGIDYEWSVAFLAGTRALFEVAIQEVLSVTGMGFGSVLPGGAEGSSAMEQINGAAARFFADWVPAGAAAGSYTPEREEVRNYLLGNRRFIRAMNRLDSAWRSLLAELYNLSTNPRWQMAASMDPALQTDLDALTIAVLSADLYRLSSDILPITQEKFPIGDEGPGIIWIPALSFYKNIPELTGNTQDDEPMIFIARVNLGYMFGDSHTQTWLNLRKDWLTDYFQSFFSKKTSKELLPTTLVDPTTALWQSSRFKAELIHPVNKKFVLNHRFGKNNAYGLRDIAFLRFRVIEGL